MLKFFINKRIKNNEIKVLVRQFFSRKIYPKTIILDNLKQILDNNLQTPDPTNKGIANQTTDNKEHIIFSFSEIEKSIQTSDQDTQEQFKRHKKLFESNKELKDSLNEIYENYSNYNYEYSKSTLYRFLVLLDQLCDIGSTKLYLRTKNNSFSHLIDKFGEDFNYLFENDPELLVRYNLLYFMTINKGEFSEAIYSLYNNSKDTAQIEKTLNFRISIVKNNQNLEDELVDALAYEKNFKTIPTAVVRDPLFKYNEKYYKKILAEGELQSKRNVERMRGLIAALKNYKNSLSYEGLNNVEKVLAKYIINNAIDIFDKDYLESREELTRLSNYLGEKVKALRKSKLEGNISINLDNISEIYNPLFSGETNLQVQYNKVSQVFDEDTAMRLLKEYVKAEQYKGEVHHFTELLRMDLILVPILFRNIDEAWRSVRVIHYDDGVLDNINTYTSHQKTYINNKELNKIISHLNYVKGETVRIESTDDKPNTPSTGAKNITLGDFYKKEIRHENIAKETVKQAKVDVKLAFSGKTGKLVVPTKKEHKGHKESNLHFKQIITPSDMGQTQDTSKKLLTIEKPAKIQKPIKEDKAIKMETPKKPTIIEKPIAETNKDKTIKETLTPKKPTILEKPIAETNKDNTIQVTLTPKKPTILEKPIAETNKDNTIQETLTPKKPTTAEKPITDNTIQEILTPKKHTILEKPIAETNKDNTIQDTLTPKKPTIIEKPIKDNTIQDTLTPKKPIIVEKPIKDNTIQETLTPKKPTTAEKPITDNTIQEILTPKKHTILEKPIAETNKDNTIQDTLTPKKPTIIEKPIKDNTIQETLTPKKPIIVEKPIKDNTIQETLTPKKHTILEKPIKDNTIQETLTPKKHTILEKPIAETNKDNTIQDTLTPKKPTIIEKPIKDNTIQETLTPKKPIIVEKPIKDNTIQETLTPKKPTILEKPIAETNKDNTIQVTLIPKVPVNLEENEPREQPERRLKRTNSYTFGFYKNIKRSFSASFDREINNPPSNTSQSGKLVIPKVKPQEQTKEKEKEKEKKQASKLFTTIKETTKPVVETAKPQQKLEFIIPQKSERVAEVKEQTITSKSSKAKPQIFAPVNKESKSQSQPLKKTDEKVIIEKLQKTNKEENLFNIFINKNYDNIDTVLAKEKYNIAYWQVRLNKVASNPLLVNTDLNDSSDIDASLILERSLR
jgi:hypothetical protein